MKRQNVAHILRRCTWSACMKPERTRMWIHFAKLDTTFTRSWIYSSLSWWVLIFVCMNTSKWMAGRCFMFYGSVWRRVKTRAESSHRKSSWNTMPRFCHSKCIMGWLVRVANLSSRHVLLICHLEVMSCRDHESRQLDSCVLPSSQLSSFLRFYISLLRNHVWHS